MEFAQLSFKRRSKFGELFVHIGPEVKLNILGMNIHI